jgi:hypothetical protein
MKRFSHIFMAACLALWPSLALADGLIPAVNAYRNTPAFWFVFAVVVLIESVCARLWLRSVHLLSALWRVLVLNAVSSLAGYLLMRSPLRPDFTYVWQQAIPFFILTLGVELPLFLILFKRQPCSWKQRLLVGTVANVLSYVFLVVAERPIEGVWLNRLWTADQRTLSQWVDLKMLSNASGRVYGTESEGYHRVPPHRLRYLDLPEGKWYSMTNCPPVNPGLWDVEGDLFAFKYYDSEDHTDRDIAIRRLPDFNVVSDIVISNAAQAHSVWDLRLSPDTTKLAVLFPLHEIQAPLRGSSYRCFGTASTLAIFDTASGTIIATCPRKAFGGLCWLPDSEGVLFGSLRNETLHSLTTLEKKWKTNYPDADKQFSDAPTYVYDIATGSVAYFGEMKSVQLAAQAGRLVYTLGNDTICRLDPASGKTTSVHVGRLGYRGITVSPDAKLAVAHFTLTHPLAYLGYATIVDLQDPQRRHYIEGFDYRLDWTTDIEIRTR